MKTAFHTDLPDLRYLAMYHLKDRTFSGLWCDFWSVPEGTSTKSRLPDDPSWRPIWWWWWCAVARGAALHGAAVRPGNNDALQLL